MVQHKHFRMALSILNLRAARVGQLARSWPAGNAETGPEDSDGAQLPPLLIVKPARWLVL